MSWTTAADVRAQVSNWWERGELLAALVQLDEPSFPRRLRFKTPGSAELSSNFDAVREWIKQVKSIPFCRVETKTVNHRLVGRNEIPAQLWIESAADAVAMISKKRDASRFVELIELTKEEHPKLIPWMIEKPLEALSLYKDWRLLLDVVSWILAHPAPQCYLRQIDVPGVHSKFIEHHRGVLSELLNLVLPEELVDKRFSGAAQFALRYGFLDKPLRVRFRVLDQSQWFLARGGQTEDVTLDADTFTRLRPEIRNVFVTENEINFLAFPQVPDSMVIFGGGYGLEILKRTSWLFHCNVFYWGDIDTHGFAILNSARKALPHVQSLLMDEETLLAHRAHWVPEFSQHPAELLDELTLKEQSIYTKLKEHIWGDRIRLEQEKVGWHHVMRRVRSALDSIEQSTDDIMSISVEDIVDYLTPSKCDKRVYLRAHGAPSANSESEFDVYLHELSKRHKCTYVSQLGHVLDLRELPLTERILATTTAIDQGAPIIIGALFAKGTPFAGTSVKFIGGPDMLCREGDGYVLRHVSIAHDVSMNEHPELFAKMQLCEWLYLEATRRNPVRSELVNGAGQVTVPALPVETHGLRHACEVVRARQAEVQPYSPVGWSKCHRCDFKEYCWSEAQKNEDVSLLYGVEQAMAHALRKAGAASVPQLVERLDEDSLASVQFSAGGKQQRIGQRARTILTMGRSMIENRPILMASPNLPRRDTVVMLDLEGVPQILGSAARIYLWGMQVFGPEPGAYTSNLAVSIGDDEAAWDGFLRHLKTIFDKHGDVPVLHWHTYEQSHIEHYVTRYGDERGVVKQLLANLVDLLPLVRNSVCLPIPSYSIKLVEQWAGFRRKHQQRDGTWAVRQFMQLSSPGDSAHKESIIEELQSYNQEDLGAMWAVFNWLKTVQ